MVFQKRLEYGSRSFQVPAMPRVPKSAKGKRTARKKFHDKQMSAFDMLATLAGQLLLEKEQYLTPKDSLVSLDSCAGKEIIKQEQPVEDKGPQKPEALESGSSYHSTFSPEIVLQTQVTGSFSECLHTPIAIPAQKDSVLNCYTSEKSNISEQFTTCSNRDEIVHPVGSELGECFRGGTPQSGACPSKFPGEKQWLQTDPENVVCVLDGYSTRFHDSPGVVMEVDARPSAFVSSDCSVEVALCCNHNSKRSSFPMLRDDMELNVNRDDDETSSGCTHPSTHTSVAFNKQCIAGHRLRKILNKNWRAVSPSWNDGELSSCNRRMKRVLRNRKACFTRRNLLKRNKVFQHYSIFKPPCMGELHAETSYSTANKVIGARLSSSNDSKSSYQSGDVHVRLSIKSFKVPELSIELPETATVGALKRTVVEAVTAILGGELRVGVLLQDKKVGDDSKTLQQAGIFHGDKLDKIGFTLEPNISQSTEQVTMSEFHSNVSELPTRQPAGNPYTVETASKCLLNLIVNTADTDHDSVQSPAYPLVQDKGTESSKELVPIPARRIDALAVKPVCKPKSGEVVQRRTRRPFSAAEVEALVQAVEKLGTGRWRDVKLQAFDNANHRTYVDLKDKWKTLVHTARISPQQRRGEPVPQELLDRVLSAHAYWSEQQSKLLVNPLQASGCFQLFDL